MNSRSTYYKKYYAARKARYKLIRRKYYLSHRGKLLRAAKTYCRKNSAAINKRRRANWKKYGTQACAHVGT